MSKLVAALLAFLLLAPASALAADETLLSGYGGPGGGEQAVLGSTLLPPARGDGSLRAPARGGSAPATSAPAAPAGAPAQPAPAPAPAEDAAGSSAGSSGGSGSDGGRSTEGSGGARSDDGSGGSRPSGTPATAAPPLTDPGTRPSAGPLEATPTAAASPPPFSRPDVVLALLGLLAIAVVAGLTRLVARMGAPEPRTATR